MNRKKLLIFLCILLAFLALLLLLKGIKLSFREAPESEATAVSGSPVLSVSDTSSPEATPVTRKEVNIFLNHTGK